MAERRGGNEKIEIIEERTLAEVPRKQDGSEVLRLQAVRARAADNGKEVRWISLRVFWSRDGQWLPGKAGVTIRGRELRPLVEALNRVLANAEQRQAPPPQRPAPAPDPQPGFVDFDGEGDDGWGRSR